jgi:hypothetical protein
LIRIKKVLLIAHRRTLPHSGSVLLSLQALAYYEQVPVLANRAPLNRHIVSDGGDGTLQSGGAVV